MINPDRIHCTKKDGIAEAAQEAFTDLDESLLDVDTNCEDTNDDSDCDDSDCDDSDCDDNEEIDILIVTF